MNNSSQISLKDLFVSIWNHLIHSSGAITIFIVTIVAILAYLFFHAQTGPQTHTWTAVYCHSKGCDFEKVEVSGKIYKNQEQSCPSRYPVFKRYAYIIVLVSIYEDYFLQSETCKIALVTSQ